MALPSTAVPRPWVQVACICERVLMEPDSVASLIRVVDTFFIPDPPAELPPDVAKQLGTNLTIFVSLKSGNVRGEHEIGIRFVPPDGLEPPVRRWPVEFRGDESGVTLTIGFGLQGNRYGLYWFDVLWGDEVLTRIPLRLKPRSTESMGAESAPTETATH